MTEENLTTSTLTVGNNNNNDDNNNQRVLAAERKKKIGTTLGDGSQLGWALSAIAAVLLGESDHIPPLWTAAGYRASCHYLARIARGRQLQKIVAKPNQKLIKNSKSIATCCIFSIFF